MSGISSTALVRIAVAVIVERRSAKSPWADFMWRPLAVLVGNPETAPWTPLDEAQDAILFYAGDAVIELYRTETANYRSNLASGTPLLWVILRPDTSHPFKLLAVTADPAEGEAFTDAGSDLVEPVPMPPAIVAAIGNFIAEHHVERPFVKRRRDRAANGFPRRRRRPRGMSEGFVSRWSRLKLESRSRRRHETGLRESAARSSAVATIAANEDEVADAESAATSTFDLTRLPSIDSITAGTDISVFLQSGVPVKLTEAALRRAWVSDPAIRDFIGIAENQWDFTNPTTIPGFGLLQGTCDGLSLVAQTAGVPSRSLDEPSALPDTCPPAEKTRSVTADSLCGPIKDRTRETQGASAPRAVDSEMSNAASDNCQGAAPPQNNFFPRNTAPRRRRHAHGGALPR